MILRVSCKVAEYDIADCQLPIGRRPTGIENSTDFVDRVEKVAILDTAEWRCLQVLSTAPADVLALRRSISASVHAIHSGKKDMEMKHGPNGPD